MSEFKRFSRLIKSYIPDFSRRRDIGDYYQKEEARAIINEMAMDIPPKVLSAILGSEKILEEFISGIYQVEDKIRKKIVTEHSVIDPKYDPKAIIEEGRLVFTVKLKGEETLFAEFRLNYKK